MYSIKTKEQCASKLRLEGESLHNLYNDGLWTLHAISPNLKAYGIPFCKMTISCTEQYLFVLITVSKSIK